MVLTISGLISRDKTSSTIFTVASSVTRWPWMKFAFSPAFSIARVMALPPPWTTTGLISTASRKTMSRATPLRTFASGESMKLPPYLTTKVAPLNFWIYGSASSSVAALAIKSCTPFFQGGGVKKKSFFSPLLFWGGGGFFFFPSLPSLCFSSSVPPRPPPPPPPPQPPVPPGAGGISQFPPPRAPLFPPPGPPPRFRRRGGGRGGRHPHCFSPPPRRRGGGLRFSLRKKMGFLPETFFEWGPPLFLGRARGADSKRKGFCDLRRHAGRGLAENHQSALRFNRRRPRYSSSVRRSMPMNT